MKKIMVMLLFMFLISCTPNTPDSPDYCTTDTDCVPAECCHPTSAVNQDNAPDCSGTFCTEECRPNTLDCQQGEIKCLLNKCTVVLQ